ncbi:uncharacterized protein EI90DRAFT_3082899 [Cantharellus anzutake]|uniref:uncharacterized protein n=1 Tax=Cantharellus anzutake TaxID=1750568 RepID=UPI0019076240|nr:uncharacterized protein EI90DRAFT_3082899 [Cantharellus anzutake]KAF8318811.1 hypothetical protein EI90DRAFT_3082899 [Cantharellus anzutake]
MPLLTHPHTFQYWWLVVPTTSFRTLQAVLSRASGVDITIRLASYHRVYLLRNARDNSILYCLFTTLLRNEISQLSRYTLALATWHQSTYW